MDVPLAEGRVRTVLQWAYYAVVPIHLWEASLAYRTCSSHQANAFISVRLRALAIIFNLPVLGPKAGVLEVGTYASVYIHFPPPFVTWALLFRNNCANV